MTYSIKQTKFNTLENQSNHKSKSYNGSQKSKKRNSSTTQKKTIKPQKEKREKMNKRQLKNQQGNTI